LRERLRSLLRRKLLPFHFSFKKPEGVGFPTHSGKEAHDRPTN
jgi:hypothetical protein